MPKTHVVVGIAGAGKTSYAMDLIDQALRDGLKWWQIGFFSFSRAACAEAAQRAAGICNVDPDKLQKDGFFRTLHSAALRMLGIDAKMVVDPDRIKDQDWLEEHLGSKRGGERGTLAAMTGDCLDKWDIARARLAPVFPNDVLAKCSLLNGPDGPDGARQNNLSGPCRKSNVGRALGVGGSSAGPHAENLSGPSGSPMFSAVSEGCSVCDFRFSTYMGHFLKGNSDNRDQRDLYGPSGPVDLSPCPIYSYRGQTRGQTADFVWPVWPIQIEQMFSVDDQFERLIRKYEDSKRWEGRVDFVDLLLKYAGIHYRDLRVPEDTFAEGSVPEELKLVIVDEFQDCSPLLDAVAQRLASQADDLWLLGDRYQAVYGFSGSDWRVMAAREDEAKQEGLRTVLNRSWRNPPQILDWGEQILHEDPQYDDRKPFSEVEDGSTGMVEFNDFNARLEKLAGSDTMILGRAWFALEKVQRQLDLLGVPWKSTNQEKRSRWEAPVKIAYTLVMRELAEGKRISESDFRRLTSELPQKHDGKELFTRGVKSRWAKLECSNSPQKTLEETLVWGATPYFIEFVTNGYWRVESIGLIDQAINRFGIDEVRNPGIRLGTVHSVKGMEAENVFVLSTSSEKASGTAANFYEELFLRYVAVTRASRHYRVVVDLVEQARGRTLFLACPKNYWKFTEMPVVEPRKRRTVESPEMDEGPRDLCDQIPGGSVWGEGCPGPADLHPGDVSCDRDESQQERPDSHPETSPDTNLEEWWNL